MVWKEDRARPEGGLYPVSAREEEGEVGRIFIPLHVAEGEEESGLGVVGVVVVLLLTALLLLLLLLLYSA